MAERHEASSGAGAARVREVAMVGGERSTVDLIKDAVNSIQGIIRSEIRLANAEMKEKAGKASKAGIVLAAGGALALYAFGFLLVTIYQALILAIPAWLSALIIFAVLAIAGGIMLSAGRNRLKQIKPQPEMTMESVKEDMEWVKRRTL
ncbi:MAG: phage holin family protein [Rhodospirillales bacterium]